MQISFFRLVERKRLDEEVRIRRQQQSAAVRRIYQGPERPKPPINNTHFPVPLHQRISQGYYQKPNQQSSNRISHLETGVSNLQNVISDLREEMLSSMAISYERSHREATFISSQITSLHELVEDLSRCMKERVTTNTGIITRNDYCAVCENRRRSDPIVVPPAKHFGSGDSVLTESTFSHSHRKSVGSAVLDSGGHSVNMVRSPMTVDLTVTVIVDSVSFRANSNAFSDRSNGKTATALIIKISFIGKEPDRNGTTPYHSGLVIDRPKKPDDVVLVDKLAGKRCSGVS